MKQNAAPITVVVVAFAMAVLSMVPSAHAQQCSSAGALGTYGVSDAGKVVGIGPRAAVGFLTFKASGKIDGSVTASLNGGISETTLSGTYKVNPNCTGTASFDEFDQSENLILTATVSIVWDANMREARFIFTSIVLADGTTLETVINGDARKLFAEGED